MPRGKKSTAPRRRPSASGDAWNRNDEKLYGIMGGKDKTKYAEDQATYRQFGRTYGGPTDAVSVGERKRREAGNFSFGEKPKKRAITAKEAKAIAGKRINPLSPMMSRSAQSKRMTKQAQTIAMDKVKKKRAVSADSKRKTGQAIDMLGKKKAAPSKPPKRSSRRGIPKERQRRGQ
jgi:hypothetical protein